jgi:hypothetical protein
VVEGTGLVSLFFPNETTIDQTATDPDYGLLKVFNVISVSIAGLGWQGNQRQA